MEPSATIENYGRHDITSPGSETVISREHDVRHYPAAVYVALRDAIDHGRCIVADDGNLETSNGRDYSCLTLLKRTITAVSVPLLVILSGSPTHTTAKEAATMQITSPVFDHEGMIPAKYTCEGADISPPLAWRDIPENTKSLALIVDDPDAPDPAAPRRTWVHWVLYDIPPTLAGLEEGAAAHLPPGVREGMNDFNRSRYGGPCPPIGKHRYFFKLYALDTSFGTLSRAGKAELEKAMQGHILMKAELLGLYQKGR